MPQGNILDEARIKQIPTITPISALLNSSVFLPFIKKRSKVPDNEIQKAIGQRTKYFEEKQIKNKKK